jgi:hypothetical protein
MNMRIPWALPDTVDENKYKNHGQKPCGGTRALKLIAKLLILLEDSNED